jgi:signal transduction histidine kinase
VATVERDGADLYRMCGVFQDITLLKNAEEDMKNMKNAADLSNQAKTEFLTNIIKEIKGSMSIISGFARTLMKEVTGARNIYYLKSIYISGKLLMNLSDEIIELSSLEYGRTRTSTKNANIQNLIREVREIFRMKLNQRNYTGYHRDQACADKSCQQCRQIYRQGFYFNYLPKTIYQRAQG